MAITTIFMFLIPFYSSNSKNHLLVVFTFYFKQFIAVLSRKRDIVFGTRINMFIKLYIEAYIRREGSYHKDVHVHGTESMDSIL